MSANDKARVVVVDYEAGNLQSVENALRHLGRAYRVARRPEEIRDGSRLIFPGDGEARAAMDVLNRTGMGESFKEFFRSGKPMLGICIGAHIIFDRSEERKTDCLGIIPGEVRRLPSESQKVPHMGWNRVFPRAPHPLFGGIPDGSYFYFVHSYYPVPARPEDAAAETEYGLRFPSVIAHDNLAAVQFHTEKSSGLGLKLLANFLEWEP